MVDLDQTQQEKVEADVTALYRTLLLRDPDPAGLKAYAKLC